MITEKTRIQEWLRRVANEVSEIKTTSMTNDDALKIIKSNYEVLSVLTKVATGNAYMVGVPPIIQKHINN
jgi:hypothetical protein